jgi:hypothetical protein
LWEQGKRSKTWAIRHDRYIFTLGLWGARGGNEGEPKLGTS